MPTTGMTTAMAVFAPVSSPLLPPVPLLELSFARAAAEEDAAAASSALVVEEGAALVAVSLGWSLVIVTLTTTVLPLVPSAGLVGAWVITDVMTCVVPSAEGAVDVRVTSAEDSGAVVSSAVVSSEAEDVEDVAAAEVVSSVEDVMGWEMELVRLLEVVTVVKAALVGEEDMAAAAAVVSGSVSDGDRRQHTGRVGHDGKQAIASTTGCGRVGFDSVARGAGFVKSRRAMVECDGSSDMQGGRVGRQRTVRARGGVGVSRERWWCCPCQCPLVTKKSWMKIVARRVCRGSECVILQVKQVSGIRE